MVTRVNLHFEGDDDLRPGFRNLLDRHIERARRQRIRFNLIAGGPRYETVKDFLDSCRHNPSALNVLLIDSESSVSDVSQSIRTLSRHSVWDSDVHCEDSQVNFMVQAMEAWFVADRRALESHFGNRFNANALPSPQSAEAIDPDALVAAIQSGLPSRRGRRRPRCRKTADGVELLGLLDHSTVGRYCPNFKRLMDFLDRQF